MKILGVILLVLGIILTVYTGVTFFTKDKVVDLGEVEISKQDKHHMDWSPLVGVLVMVTGGAILFVERKK